MIVSVCVEMVIVVVEDLPVDLLMKKVYNTSVWSNGRGWMDG